MGCWRGRRMWRLLGLAIVITFLAGCFMAITSLTSVDSSRETEVALSVMKQLKKHSLLEKERSHSANSRNNITKVQLSAIKSINKTEVKVGGRNRTAKSRSDIPLGETIGPLRRGAAKQGPGAVGEIQNGKLGFPKSDNSSQWPIPNYKLHAFYYPWYGNPEFDGTYLHWNHKILRHWNRVEAKRWPRGQWKPPGDIGANFYPKLGCYSSRDPAVIEDHMRQLRLAGIGVLSISWYPAELADEQGKPSDDMMPAYLDAAHRHDLKVTFHSEPYKGRTEMTFLQDVRYIVDKYGSHPAFYRHTFKGRTLPVFYVYDSYLINASNWARIFDIHGELSVRNTKYDAFFLGLYVETRHKNDILVGGFDGFYTYFASNGFTYASRWQNWKLLMDFSRKRGLLFVPSVGPGYIDTRVRPWNQMNTKERDNGDYYNRSFQSAINVQPGIISITSFNEWHEGTQIERAISKTVPNFTYMDYGPEGPDKYLIQTQKWSKLFPGEG